MEITLPVIHLNGTGAKTLLEDNVAASEAIRNALSVIHKVEFHSRDYYPNDSWEKARKEYLDRIRALQEAQNYFMEVAFHASKHIKN